MTEQHPSATPAWRYTIGMFGSSLPITMIRTSMALYWIDIVGLDARTYAIVMAIYGVIDAIDNPVLGYLSDNTRTRWGRRRPWLTVGATVLAAALVGFFAMPSGLEGPAMVAWFAFFAIVCELADSMFNANYSSLLPELFTDEISRAKANSMRQVFQLLALVVAMGATPVLTTSVFGTDSTPEGFTITAAIYAVVALTVILFMVVGVREHPPAPTEHRPHFFRSIFQIMSERTFWLVGLASACYLIPLGILGGSVQLYVKYTLDLPVKQTTIIMGVVILVAIAGIAAWTAIVRVKGAPFVWRLGYVLLAVGFIPLYFATDLVGASIAGIVIAIGWAALLSTNDLIQARVLDDDARRHGIHREGIFLAAFGFFGRLTGALSGLGFWLISVLYGYQNQDVPGPDPEGAFRFLVSVIPFFVTVIGAVLSRLISLPESGRD